MLMMICLPPQGTPPPTQQPARLTAHPAHSQHCRHTVRATPRVEDNTPVDALAPLKRSMLAPFGGPRPRVISAKARERWLLVHPSKRLRLKKNLYYKKKKKKKKDPRISHIIIPGWPWRFGAAAAAALDVSGYGGWLCQYRVAPTASVAVARLVGKVVTVIGVLSY